MSARLLRAVGLMSGTSMDGIDVALIETDGERCFRPVAACTIAYPEPLRSRLAVRVRARGGPPALLQAVARELTLYHAAAVRALLAGLPPAARRVDLVGFHGHTVDHQPARGRTLQLGDGELLAAELGLPVVYDFRSADVRAGGEGAPLAPLFHACLVDRLERPLAVLNIGGIANLTFLGADGALLAFDTGPGNALLDDWLRETSGRPFDADGALAAAGQVDEDRLRTLLAHPWFDRPPPKSLDRGDFDLEAVRGASPADGAATLAAFTAAAVARALRFLPAAPLRWLVTGGGRHNRTLMAMLRARLGVPVEPIETIGADGDALEAQCFAYLAVRVLRGLPTSLPSTTGASAPVCGGRIVRPAAGDR